MSPHRIVYVNLSSGHDLKVVNCFTRMEVYAIVKISGDKDHKQKVKSHTDPDGGANPTWDFSTQFTVDESMLQRDKLKLVFKLMSERTLGDKDVGRVKIPLRELLHSAGDDNSFQSVSYQVKKPSGKPKGMLTFAYRFGESFDVPSSEDGHGFGPPGSHYPPPPQYGHGYPPPGGYPPYPGHAYPPPGYGYRPPQQKEKEEKPGWGGFTGGAIIGAVGTLLEVQGGGEEEEEKHSSSASSSSSSAGSD